jgi:hypothetical protein
MKVFARTIWCLVAIAVALTLFAILSTGSDCSWREYSYACSVASSGSRIVLAIVVFIVIAFTGVLRQPEVGAVLALFAVIGIVWVATDMLILPQLLDCARRNDCTMIGPAAWVSSGLSASAIAIVVSIAFKFFRDKLLLRAASTNLSRM